MNAIANKDSDMCKNISIGFDENGQQVITYTKKGYGVMKTNRPLGAVRLELALDEAEISQSELARRIGARQPAISRIMTGETRNSHLISAIAKELNKTPEWLAGNVTADKTIALIHKNILVIDEAPFVLVQHYSANTNEDHPDAKSIVVVSSEQISNPENKEHLRFSIEPDRAMSPDIKQGASVIFNTSDTRITNGDMFVIKVGDTVCTRCLFSQHDGSILIRAKESDFPDYALSSTDDSFKVLGRVLFVTNKL